MSPHPSFRPRNPEAYPVVECPRCSEPITVRLMYGLFEEVMEPCGSGCHTRFTSDEWAALEQAARDAAESEPEREPDDEWEER